MKHYIVKTKYFKKNVMTYIERNNKKNSNIKN